MALVTTLNFSLNLKETKTFGGITIPAERRFTVNDELASGTTLDKADVDWFDEARSLSGSANEELDLAGVLTNAFGATATFVKVKGIYIKNRSTTAGDILEIGGSATNAFLLFKDATDIYKLGPDGVFFVWNPSLAGHAVTAGTGDKLKINNTSGTAVTFDIAIIGTSA